MDLLEFVAHLKRRPWDDKNHPVHRFRVEFLKDPGGVMDAMGLIGAEDRAYICSLREIEIGDRVGINQHAMRIFASAITGQTSGPKPATLGSTTGRTIPSARRNAARQTNQAHAGRGPNTGFTRSTRRLCTSSTRDVLTRTSS